jgi:uncharacterized protein YndB with AHSA1/START domain
MSKPKFVYVTYINTTPEELWKALTTTDLIRQYWSGRVNESKWKKGAVLESRTPKGELEWHGKILESKRPRLLSYTFDVVDGNEPASRVVFEIERPKRADKHKAIKLTVTHDEFPAESKIYHGISEGWPTILSSLKSLLETGRAIDFTLE